MQKGAATVHCHYIRIFLLLRFLLLTLYNYPLQRKILNKDLKELEEASKKMEAKQFIIEDQELIIYSQKKELEKLKDSMTKKVEKFEKEKLDLKTKLENAEGKDKFMCRHINNRWLKKVSSRSARVPYRPSIIFRFCPSHQVR